MAKVLGPALVAFGYKRKGTRFIRMQNGLDYSFHLERSSWNSLTDRPKQLSVHLEVYSGRKVYASINLFRVTKLEFPSYYAPFFLDDLTWPEKGSLMASFSPEQVEEIDRYLASINWYYASEEALINTLEQIKTQLINVGLPTIDSIKINGAEELEAFGLQVELKKKSNQLYLMQLDPEYRFPLID